MKDLLRLARLEAGQETVEYASCDVQALVASVAADFDSVVRDKRQLVSINVPAEARMLVADPAKLADDASLLDQGIIDSTGVLEVIGFLESTFNITVEDAEMLPENLDSIQRISDFVARKQG